MSAEIEERILPYSLLVIDPCDEFGGWCPRLDRGRKPPTLPDFTNREIHPSEEGKSLMGISSTEFWRDFIGNNLEREGQRVLREGDFAIYPLTPHTGRSVDTMVRPINRNDVPAELVHYSLNAMTECGPSELEIVAISTTFSLPMQIDYKGKKQARWFSGYPWAHINLLACDLEAPPTDDFLQQIVSVHKELEIPVVIFNTGDSFFSVCLGSAYTDDFALARDYSLITKRIITEVEPEKLGWVEKILDPLGRCNDRETLIEIANYVLRTIGHWGEERATCVDLRNFFRGVMTTAIDREKSLWDMGDPSLRTQLFMRVGPKGKKGTPVVVHASPRIPFLIGETIPFKGELANLFDEAVKRKFELSP